MCGNFDHKVLKSCMSDRVPSINVVQPCSPSPSSATSHHDLVPQSQRLTKHYTGTMPRTPEFWMDLMLRNACFESTDLYFKELCWQLQVTRQQGQIEVPTLTPLSAFDDRDTILKKPLPLWKTQINGRQQHLTRRMLKPGEKVIEDNAEEGWEFRAFRTGMPGPRMTVGGDGGKVHWDLVLEEMRVASLDFRGERRVMTDLAWCLARWCWWGQGRRRRARGELVAADEAGDREFAVVKRSWDEVRDGAGAISGYGPEKHLTVGLGYRCEGIQLRRLLTVVAAPDLDRGDVEGEGGMHTSLPGLATTTSYPVELLKPEPRELMPMCTCPSELRAKSA